MNEYFNPEPDNGMVRNFTIGFFAGILLCLLLWLIMYMIIGMLEMNRY